MKKKEKYIMLTILVDGKQEEIQILADELRQAIKEAKFGKDVKDIRLQLDSPGRTLQIPMKISEVRMLLKQSQLCSKIIPNSLDQYLVDLTQKISQKPISPISGRDNEIEKIWFYISQKNRNNVFIIGDVDVGKTAIANEIARQISTNECPKEFYEKRVIMLRPDALLKIKSDYVLERTVKKILNFLVKNKKKLILYIDKAIYMKTDTWLIIMLLACIKKYNIPIITTASVEDYENYFYGDTSIAKYLNDVYVEEPELEEVEPMIRTHIALFEKRYKVKISEEMVQYGIYTTPLSDSVSVNPGNAISIFEKAFLEARRKGKKFVDKQCILSCYGTRVKEYEKTPMEEKRATAYHETGHYIVTVMSENRTDIKISCVSNLPMNWWAGVTMSYLDLGELSVHSKEYYIDRIAVSLAGRIAEKKFTGLNSTGASNDLENANLIARAIVMEWGFSEGENNKNRSYDVKDLYLMPESKKEAIDKEIQELIDAGTKRAEDIINANEELLKLIAERLLTDEILTGKQLEQICKEYEESNK